MQMVQQLVQCETSSSDHATSCWLHEASRWLRSLKSSGASSSRRAAVLASKIGTYHSFSSAVAIPLVGMFGMEFY